MIRTAVFRSIAASPSLAVHSWRSPGSARRRGVCATTLIVLALGIAACDSPSDSPLPASLEPVTTVARSAVAGEAVEGGAVVRVLDTRGRAVAGVPVTFLVSGGGGSIAVAGNAGPTAMVRSGVDGRAAVEWTLGGTVGTNAVTASAPGLSPILFMVNGLAGPPSEILIEAGDAQTGTVATPLPIAPLIRLKDTHGNGVPGVTVAFRAVTGGGGVTHASTETDALGLATAGNWVLGTQAGEQRLEASVAGFRDVVFTASALPGPPVSLRRAAGHGQQATVATAVAVPPAVIAVDAHGNQVAGVTIVFEVTVGDGVIGLAQADGASMASSLALSADADGLASVPGWILGRIAGRNTLRAKLATGEAIDFDATGTAGAPRAVRVHGGQGQNGVVGKPVGVQPAVFVGDAFDNPVAGIGVLFAVTSGGGSLASTEVRSNVQGIATAVWTLGPTAGTNTLTATVPGLAPISFHATSTASGGGGAAFDIDIRFVTPVSASQRAVFDGAAARWTAVITGDLPDLSVSVAANACGISHGSLAETIDDLLILVSIEPIDGPGKVLGSAGPCYVRNSSRLPIVGVILIDAADVSAMEASGSLMAVVQHEIGHVLGFGTLWHNPPLVGAGSADPHFVGSSAVGAFSVAGGSGYPGSPVPVENTGGAGTRDGHWRETVFGSELMTGWINAGANPLSAITIASLQDIGYKVHVGAADGYSLSAAAAAAQSLEPVPSLELRERPLPITPIPIDDRGRVSATGR